MSIKAIARLAILIIGFAIVWSLAIAKPGHDLVIRNGLIIDGTGNPGFHADIAVDNGRITRIGTALGSAKREIDAKGLVVSPGFIDVHTHAENIIELPNAENFLRMGVTTLVVGNCGTSEENIGKFFEGLIERPVAANVASLVGHNTIRKMAMGGSFNRPPTESEIETMKRLTDEAMRDGAVGLSTGLIYLPGTFAKTDEIVELAKVAAKYDGIYASHMRNESVRIDSAIDELLEVAKRAHIRVELSHIKLGGESMWGKASIILDKLEKARSEGIDVTQDQYAYTASSTSLSVLIPDKYLEGEPAEFVKRISDRAIRESLSAEMKATLQSRGGKDFAYAVIASCPSRKSLNGKSVVEASQEVLGRTALDDQIETILKIQSEGGAKCIFHGMDENDVKTFMRHPNTMIASDAACRDLGEDVPHPRGYGNNARVLGKYARDERVLRLEDAIRKMTTLPAQTFRLRDRGMLAEGRAADIVIFDPIKVSDPATYTQPHQLAKGVMFVFVNGIETVKDEKSTGARAGTPLRGPGFEPKMTTKDGH